MKVAVLKLNNNSSTTDLDLSNENKLNLKDVALVNRVRNQALKQGTKHVKTRSEVVGGKKKPFRQKGTGNARQGSTVSAHHVGGGVAHGPMPDFSKLKLNKKFKTQVLRDTIFNIIENNKLSFVELSDNKKDLRGFFIAKPKSLLIYSDVNKDLTKFIRNLGNVDLVRMGNLSPFDLIHSDNVYVDLGCKEELVNILKK
jgi:large subunit ribosomal protein L4